MIDYSIINDSIAYYETKGFQRIESPWTITSAISDITRPKDAGEFTIKEKNKVLVASGEQSFLYLYNKGFLPKGKFQTVTPCFRDELFDTYHTKYFIKNELIITDKVDESELAVIIHRARKFFEKYITPIDLKFTGKNSADLFYKDVELGSYGIRKCEFLEWIYGTGVAEPRLSRVLQKYGIPHS